ncbi:MAG TPA: amino acid adenylation domain-containing protein, partial [Caldimonas sp.]|nr:amino acid adenylation domain-containing protein [Caldimonas sp.]
GFSVHQLFEAQTAATPETIAIADDGATLTYRQLNARANRLAHYLRAQGVEPGQRVGVCLERSPALVFTLLAILKAGAAYVPLDPDVPSERLAFMVHDAGASIVITREALAACLAGASCRLLQLDVERAAIAEAPADGEGVGALPSDLACVMYTSGSTGAPKGVAVPHRAIVRLVRDTDYVRLGPGDVVAQLSNPAFDAATFEIWGTLLNGARIAFVARDTVLAPRALADALKRHDVSTLFLTTALFNQVARDAPGAFSACRDVLFGGEAVDPKAVAAILRDGPPHRLIHVYGPTETVTFATWHLVTAVADDAQTVPIGRPIARTEAYILDRYGEPAPIGVAGEIHIGGPGLALGYLGQPQLTEERFVPHPFASPEARLYRTGDRARYRVDGAIEFLGRFDRQVKIRGHRVEPGELEAALLRLSQVREAVVVVRGESAESRQMVAYVAPASGAQPTPAQIMGDLRRSLPPYMLPSA